MNEPNPVESFTLPQWAADSYRFLAEQLIFFQSSPGYVSWPLRISPFTANHNGWYFGYLDNTLQSRYTYLLEKEPHAQDVHLLRIPTGYRTNLLILRKVRFFPGAGNVLFANNVRRPQGMSEKYLVLQDPLMKVSGAYADVIFAGEAQACLDLSEGLSQELGCTLLVAELRYKTWWS